MRTTLGIVGGCVRMPLRKAPVLLEEFNSAPPEHKSALLEMRNRLVPLEVQQNFKGLKTPLGDQISRIQRGEQTAVQKLADI